MWLSGLRTQHSSSEDAGLIPGLAPWVKDLAFLRAAAEGTDAAWIPSCLGTSIRCSPKKRKKKKKKENNKAVKTTTVTPPASLPFKGLCPPAVLFASFNDLGRQVVERGD